MVAVVIPTIRDIGSFERAWQPLFNKHNAIKIIIWDGATPRLEIPGEVDLTAKQVMGKYAGCLSNFNAGIRNLGFAYVAKYLPEAEYIITLDDDVTPIGDPIQDHINALNMRVPVSWMSTASEYMRGFPYGVRDEAEVVLSHGVWEGVADWDAPTQLVKGNRLVSFYKGPIPKGVYYPMCGMNIAFKRLLLPYIYFAPRTDTINRFDDIFTGIESKREIDKHGWSVVSGYARVNHQRASDVFKNLSSEAVGLNLNETFWSGDEAHEYFKLYREKYKLWQQFIKTTI